MFPWHPSAGKALRGWRWVHRKENRHIALSFGSVLANHYRRSPKKSPKLSPNRTGGREWHGELLLSITEKAKQTGTSGTRKYRVLHEVSTSGTVLLLAPICLLTWNESLLVFSSSLLFLVLSALVFFLLVYCVEANFTGIKWGRLQQKMRRVWEWVERACVLQLEQQG